MSRKQMQVTGIPEGFALTEKTLAWVDARYPNVDFDGTLERFTESALAHGRMYADWQAAFRTWVRKAIENKWDGVEFRKGRIQDPRWKSVLEDARKYGFREPEIQETPDSYRSQLSRWVGNLDANKKGTVVDFSKTFGR